MLCWDRLGWLCACAENHALWHHHFSTSRLQSMCLVGIIERRKLKIMNLQSSRVA
jgi:hypothetical protein